MLSSDWSHRHRPNEHVIGRSFDQRIAREQILGSFDKLMRGNCVVNQRGKFPLEPKFTNDLPNKLVHDGRDLTSAYGQMIFGLKEPRNVILGVIRTFGVLG